MRILRLTTSDDRLPAGQSTGDIVREFVQAGVEEPVEVTLREPWPAPGLPDLVDRWLDRYEPDIVLLAANSFWFNYLSVPLLLERKLGRVGARLGRAGVRMGEVPALNRTAAFRATRRALVRVTGGAAYFTSAEVVASMKECARRVLAREGTGLVLRGPSSRMNHELSKSAARAHEQRRQHVFQSLRRFSEDVHVPFFGQERLPSREEILAATGADNLHLGPEAARLAGLEEGAIILALWREMHGLPPPQAAN